MHGTEWYLSLEGRDLDTPARVTIALQRLTSAIRVPDLTEAHQAAIGIIARDALDALVALLVTHVTDDVRPVWYVRETDTWWMAPACDGEAVAAWLAVHPHALPVSHPEEVLSARHLALLCNGNSRILRNDA